jgi:tetratricopeptide (TPR) repeat protein
MGWNSVPEKAKEAAQLSEEQLAECGKRAEKWDPRSPVLAEVLGDAYRLKLIELYFSPSPVSQGGRVVRREKENRLAEAAVHWYRKQEKRSPNDDVPAVRRASILDLQGKFAEAAPLYLLALQQRPHSKFFQTSYGNHLWRKGDLAGAQAALEKSIALPGISRPGDEKDATTEAQEMLAKVKERIAKGGPIRQGRKFNPRED